MTARDKNGNLAEGYRQNVTVAIGTNPGAGTLAGTKTVTAVHGVATFSDLSIDKVGSGYTLRATSLKLADTSAAFDITVQAPASWTLRDLGTLGGGSANSYGINDLGQVVGSSSISGDSESHGFLWEEGNGAGTMTDLPTFGGFWTIAYAINGSSQVVGQSHTPEPNGTSHAFLWTTGDGMEDLGAYGGISGPGLFSSARAVNDNGQVVGWANPSYSEGYHAVLWENGQPMTDLNRPGGISSGANGVNATGQVVGQSTTADNSENHAFLWEKLAGTWTMTDLGTLTAGGGYSDAKAINSSCQVVGESSAPGSEDYHAFLWEKGGCAGTGPGTMMDLGTLGGTYSSAAGINDAGQIVGISTTGDTTAAGDLVRHAFVWEGGEMIDLGSLGGTYSAAAGINSNGVVIGWSSIAGDAETHAARWTPPQVP